MNQSYIFEYEGDGEFKKKERNLKKIYTAYKKLAFNYYPEIKKGNFIGRKVGTDKFGGTKYELELPTEEIFKKFHGTITVHYTVYEDKKVILFTNITPNVFLEEAHRTELHTYRGVPVSKNNKAKEMFMIDLLKFLEK